MQILSKILARTDTTSRLSLKTKILQHLPPFAEGQNAQVLKLKDEQGKNWRFRLIIRRGRYKKPVLSAGWMKFVRSKRLQRGSKVHFFREENEATGQFTYRIRLQRPIVVFNVVIGYAPYIAG